MAKRKIKKTVSKKKEPNWKMLFILTFIVLIGVSLLAVYKTWSEAHMAELYWAKHVPTTSKKGWLPKPSTKSWKFGGW